MKKSSVRLGTYISKEAYERLKELCEIYGTQTNVLEQAISFLHQICKNIKELNLENIVIREKLLNEFDNMLISRANFLHLIRREYENFYAEDFIKAIVQNILNKPLRSADLREVVKAIEKIYVGGNLWFTNVTMSTDELNEEFEIIFYHKMNLDYSKFISKYFTKFFEDLGYKINGLDLSSKLFMIKISANS